VRRCGARERKTSGCAENCGMRAAGMKNSPGTESMTHPGLIDQLDEDNMPAARPGSCSRGTPTPTGIRRGAW
jgi:hypothetical protein